MLQWIYSGVPAQANHTFLGLLAKIKCSICSLEFDNSNGGHCPPCYLTYFSGGLPNSDACIAELAAWPWHCTTALAEHPLNKNPNINTLIVVHLCGVLNNLQLHILHHNADLVPAT